MVSYFGKPIRLTRLTHRLSIRLQSAEYKSNSLTCQWSQLWFLPGAFNSSITSDFQCNWSLSMSFLAPRASKGKLEACEEARASGDTFSRKKKTWCEVTFKLHIPGRIFAVAGCISAISLLPIDSLVSLKTVAQLSTHAKLAPDSADGFMSFYSCERFNSIKFQLCVRYPMLVHSDKRDKISGVTDCRPSYLATLMLLVFDMS